MRNNTPQCANTHKNTNTSLPALPALSTQPTRTPRVVPYKWKREKKMAKIFLLTKFVRREKKDGKDFTSCQKKMTKIYQVFLVFFWGFFQAYIDCLGAQEQDGLCLGANGALVAEICAVKGGRTEKAEKQQVDAHFLYFLKHQQIGLGQQILPIKVRSRYLFWLLSQSPFQSVLADFTTFFCHLFFNYATFFW